MPPDDQFAFDFHTMARRVTWHFDGTLNWRPEDQARLDAFRAARLPADEPAGLLLPVDTDNTREDELLTELNRVRDAHERRTTALERELAEARKQAAALAHQLDAAQVVSRDCEEAANSARDAAERAESRADALESQRTVLEENISSLVVQRDAATRDRDEYASRAERLAAELRDTEELASLVDSEGSEKIAQLTRQLEAKTLALRDAAAKTDAAVRSRSELESSLEELRAQYDALETRAHDERVEAQGLIDRARRRNDEALEEIHALTVESEALRQELSVARSEADLVHGASHGTGLHFFDAWVPDDRGYREDLLELETSMSAQRHLKDLVTQIVAFEQPITLERLNYLVHRECGFFQTHTPRAVLLRDLLDDDWWFGHSGRVLAEPGFEEVVFRHSRVGEQRNTSEISLEEQVAGFRFLFGVGGCTDVFEEMASAFARLCGWSHITDREHLRRAWELAQAERSPAGAIATAS